MGLPKSHAHHGAASRSLRSGARQRAACLVALLSCWVVAAGTTPAFAQPREPRAIAWIAADTGPFAGAGAKFAFRGSAYQPGPMLLASVGTDGAALLPAYQMNILDAQLFIAAGPELRAKGGLGFRIHAEAWAQVSTRLSASLVATCGTADRECWSRSRIGWIVQGDMAIGPEAIIASDRTGVGMALTNIPVGPLTLEASGGVEREWGATRIRPYGAMALIGRF